MCTYGVGADEIEDSFIEYIKGIEGEVSAECIAQVWNKLAKKMKWEDRLIAINKRDIR